MKNSSYSNNIIKSDYVKVKGTVSLNYFNFKEKEELPVNEEVENHNEKRLELIDAQIKYDEILNQANTESEKILAETNQKAVEIEKRAYHEGYEQGTQNGYEDGYKEAYEDNIEKAKNESSEIIDKANKIMLEANNQVASYIKNNKKNILAMGISIAEKVLRRNFEDEESMDLLILDVIKEYELKENFVIRVNPIYKESLDKQILELKENNLINKDVFILSDESVDKGNALIESLNGKLVIGIDDVIGKIKEELL